MLEEIEELEKRGYRVKNRLYDFVDGEEVIAWKEIILPELEIEND